MIKKLLLNLSVFLFLLSCGFTPLYSVKSGNDINIEILKYDGDKEINLNLISKLKANSNPNGKFYKITINTVYKKTTLTKNLAGETEEYQLESNTKFIIFGENFKKQFNVSEKFTMKNFIDDFEEKNYEISIKKNISNLTYNKLIAQINRIK